ncbi:hypothetical protein Taro_041690 [Colocasia esculenta]|uniref:lipid-A-disaccharide synthase n=1 Tax=Colocasia esculenta TaxID=4460 RepID=A0A843WWK3_COLES|nr:hypothetical protein [Colocasia esculenta]
MAMRGSARWKLHLSFPASFASSSRKAMVGWRASSSWPGGDGYRPRAVDMASRDGELRVFIVAGEVSGDSIAARLMASLRRLSSFPVRFSGVGGSSMSKEGLQSLFPMEDIAVMGIWELLPHLRKIRVNLCST